MTKNEFIEILEAMELIVIESFMWPKAIRVDPKFVKEAFNTDLKMVKYKLKITDEIVPVIDGRPGEFKIVPTTLADETIK